MYGFLTPKTLKIANLANLFVEEQNKCKFLSLIFLRETTPTFLRHGVRAIYHPPFGKVWLSSVCWSPSAKPGNDVESRIYIGWVQMAVQFEAVCGPKFMLFWEDVGDPLQLSTHLTDRLSLYHVSFRRYRPLKLLLSCEVGVKRWFLGPQFVMGGDTPDFGHAFSNCTYFRACGQLS